MNTNRRAAELVITEYVKGVPGAMYDLGVGINSEWITLTEKYPGMVLFGCEPHPGEFNRLMSEFPGRLMPVAISDKAGLDSMALSEVGGGGSTLLPDHLNRPTADVEVWTLDQFDEWAGKPERILLWMDIEGSELPALRGGTELMKSGRVEWISVEVFGKPPPIAGYHSAAEIDEFLTGYGYKMVREYNHQGLHHDRIYVKR